MKFLKKKLNLVYALQIFAVLLIFGYKRPFPETRDPVIHKNSKAETNKIPAVKNEMGWLPITVYK